MRVILTILVFFFSSFAVSQVSPDTDKPPSDVYEAAKKFKFSAADVYRLNRERKRAVDTYGIALSVANSFEENGILSAQYADEALENLLRRADSVLRAMGHSNVANEIATDYTLFYRGGFMRLFAGEKEIGDHEPLADWIEKVHSKIEKSIGDFWCKFFHFHDLFILNYGLPVVWEPKKYQLPDYLDHFSGHLIGGFIWDHHGVAGVVSYWIVEGVCSVYTSGFGLITFACSPIASYAEHITDKRIAPPIAERIWQRSNN